MPGTRRFASLVLIALVGIGLCAASATTAASASATAAAPAAAAAPVAADTAGSPGEVCGACW
ncbi:hypothetical protein ACFV4G_40510 [Kitasatospora sp. NPDC059747]|uniref:hypothetical protein n=1 Tax=Kitasatospora sp. NPDC059747 TaxID=3346930 RepID=UPI00366545BA